MHYKSGEKSRLERVLLEIEKCLHEFHENEKANKEAWVIENVKSNPKALLILPLTKKQPWYSTR